MGVTIQKALQFQFKVKFYFSCTIVKLEKLCNLLNLVPLFIVNFRLYFKFSQARSRTGQNKFKNCIGSLMIRLITKKQFT